MNSQRASMVLRPPYNLTSDAEATEIELEWVDEQLKITLRRRERELLISTFMLLLSKRETAAIAAYIGDRREPEDP